jgi:predicted transcriptional regulator
MRKDALHARILEIMGDEGTTALSSEEKVILNYVAENDRVTVTTIMALLGETRWHTTSMKLNRLVKKGALVFRSTKPRDPNAFYELVSRSSDEQDSTNR